MRVAILYICTGKYSIFWKEFYASFEKYFLLNSEKEYFVFTDSDNLYKNDASSVHVLKHKFLGWPYDTLMRFDVFSRIEDQLKVFDYVFFFNANMVCKAIIKEDEFLQLSNPTINLIMVQHPGQYKLKPRYFPYERNSKSTAYIQFDQGEYYVMGALNGGKTHEFLRLINKLKNNIKIDLDNNIIAKVHDESYLNRYIIGRNDVFVLSPAYCNAEVYELPFEKKIVMLDKSKYFDVDKLKNVSNTEKTVERFIRRVKKYLYCNTMFLVNSIRNR